MLRILTLVLYVGFGHCLLFSKGIVHYYINQADYDPHSQRVIASTFAQLERELCLKFFHSPLGHNVSDVRLVISNSGHAEDCPPSSYDFSKSDVEMTVGYKCINPRDIARITMDMLRASIDRSDASINSYDLVKKYEEKDREPNSLLSREDRNYINSRYYEECGSLVANSLVARRRVADHDGSYYKNLLWPFGLVMYGIEERLRGSPGHKLLKQAMTTIEQSSCVVFQYHEHGGVLQPHHMLWFSDHGSSEPLYGFRENNQTIHLRPMTRGAAGHAAHVLNNLLRALGAPMVSNRYDRDNYVRIHWGNVEKGKEHLLEKMPEEAWLVQLPYDFDSVTHAPVNYACASCQLGATTVQPIQDLLWQRSLTMGHRTTLSRWDEKLLQILYGPECEKRNSAVN